MSNSGTTHPASFGTNNHPIISASKNAIAETYLSTTTRDADTTFNGSSSNIGKSIKVLTDPVTYYVLLTVAPTWRQANEPTYQDETARDADTDFNGTLDNVGKTVRIESPLSLHILTSVTPTWQELGSTSSITEGNLTASAQFSPEVDYIFYDGWVVQEDITITKGSLFAVTAPTGAAIIVDILINGVVQTRLLTLAIAATHQLTDITDLAVTAGQRVGVKFTQIGSTNPGNGITATLHYQLT